MTELEALRRVAEAAQAWSDAYQSNKGATIAHRSAIVMAVRALNALPTEIVVTVEAGPPTK
jgi:broad specificity phosphatase PhoE